MKRLLVSSVSVLAFVLSASACGVAKDKVAATVEGQDISVASVTALAKSTFVSQQADQGGQGLVSSPKGTIGSAKQRIALSFLVQAEIYEHAVTEKKGKITTADLAAADQQIESYEQQQQQGTKFEASVSPVVKRLFAAQAALERILGLGNAEDAATPEKIKAYFDEHASEFGVQTCVDVFAVPEASQAAAQAAVDAGTTVTEILADTALAPQSLSQDGQEVCIAAGQISEPTLAKAVSDSPVGAWAVVSVSDPQSGSLAVFVRPNSREELTAESPAVLQQITTTLQQEAEAAASEALSKLIVKATKSSDVHLDPRYGKWDPTSAELIVAPSKPKDGEATTTTSPVLGGQ